MPLQRALFQALSTLGVPVHDVVPQAPNGGDDTPFPYIKIGAIVPAEWDDYVGIGFDTAIRLHVVSRKQGFTECKDLQGRIFDLLHRADLAVEGHSVINLTRETTTCEDASPGTVRGICTYRCLSAAN